MIITFSILLLFSPGGGSAGSLYAHFTGNGDSLNRVTGVTLQKHGKVDFALSGSSLLSFLCDQEATLDFILGLPNFWASSWVSQEKVCGSKREGLCDQLHLLRRQFNSMIFMEPQLFQTNFNFKKIDFPIFIKNLGFWERGKEMVRVCWDPRTLSKGQLRLDPVLQLQHQALDLPISKGHASPPRISRAFLNPAHTD